MHIPPCTWFVGRSELDPGEEGFDGTVWAAPTPAAEAACGGHAEPYLVAERVPEEELARLIAATPDLLRAALYFTKAKGFQPQRAFYLLRAAVIRAIGEDGYLGYDHEGDAQCGDEARPELILVSDVRALVKRGGYAYGVLMLARGREPDAQADWLVWGRTPDDKTRAAEEADRLAATLLGAARNRERVEELEAICARLLADEGDDVGRTVREQALAWEALRAAMRKGAEPCPS